MFRFLIITIFFVAFGSVGTVLSGDGLSLDGLSLDGLSLDGLSLDGLSLDGLSLDGLSLDDGGGFPSMHPLDLPSGGKGDLDDDRDIPEPILFYGAAYEGDGFFWCLDKSGSMNGSDKFAQLKAETIGAIQSLSENSEFGLVAFSTGHITWSTTPRVANALNKAEATAWVSDLEAQGWTCLGPAGVEIIGISNMSDKLSKQILVLSDGRPICEGFDTSAQCLAEIKLSNWQHTPVNTIYISDDSAGIAFMQQLAAMNNGTFHIPPG